MASPDPPLTLCAPAQFMVVVVGRVETNRDALIPQDRCG